MVRLSPEAAALRLPTPASAPPPDPDLIDAVGATAPRADFDFSAQLGGGINGPVHATAAPVALGAGVSVPPEA